MNSNNFFVDLVVRLFSSNPKFFKWIMWASIGLGSLSAALNALPPTFTPAWLEWAKGSTVWAITATAAIMAKLPNSSK